MDFNPRKSETFPEVFKYKKICKTYLCRTSFYYSTSVEERKKSAYFLLDEQFGTGKAMARRSNITAYARLAEVDVALAAGVAFTVIASRHPFSRFCVARYRAALMRERRDYWRSLRKLCAERGIDKHNPIVGGGTAP